MSHQKYWLVWVDDSPIAPERPLRLEEAIADFRGEAVDEDAVVVEVRQCSAQELKWAGIL